MLVGLIRGRMFLMSCRVNLKFLVKDALHFEHLRSISMSSVEKEQRHFNVHSLVFSFILNDRQAYGFFYRMGETLQVISSIDQIHLEFLIFAFDTVYKIRLQMISFFQTNRPFDFHKLLL